MPPPSLIFSPTPEDTACVLNDLASTQHSLEDIADNYHVTVDALLAWLARPDVQDLLSRNTAAAASRTRYLAAVHMPEAVAAVVALLKASADDELRGPNLQPGLATAALAETRRANTRRAAHLLLRLARITPLAPDASLSLRESRRLCGGEGFTSYSVSTPQPPPTFAPSPALVPAAAPVLPSTRPGGPGMLPVSARPAALPPLAPDRATPQNPGTPVPGFSDAHPAPSAALTPPPAPGRLSPTQPEGLRVHSRGSSESSSATPGARTPIHPHPERVLVPLNRHPRPLRSPVANLLQRARALTGPPPDS